MVRIVAVDADADLLGMLAEIFALEGWELIPCRRASAAIGVIEQARPQVVMLDLWLDAPTAGFELLQKLADHPALSSIPVICCTGAVDQVSSRDAWLKRRCAAVLLKPFDLDDLLAAVEAALGRRRTRRLAGARPS